MASQSKATMDTVRVYGTRQSEWGAGVAWVALAAAASIAIVIGVGRVISPPTGESVANTNISVPTPPETKPPEVAKGPSPGPIPIPPNRPPELPQQSPEFVQGPREILQPIPTPKNEIVVSPQNAPVPVPQEQKQPVDKFVTKDETPAQPIPGNKGVTPQNAKPPLDVATNQTTPIDNGPRPILNPPNTPSGRLPNQQGPSVAVGGQNSIPNPNPNARIGLAENTPAAIVPEEVAGARVTGIRDGRAQYRPQGAGEPKVLAADDTVPSGSQINSDSSRICLKLPDGSKLYINANSEVIVTFRGNSADVTLNAGEVYFGGPGTITVTGPQATRVRDAKSVNVKIEDKSLVVSNLDKGAVSVSNKLRTVSLSAAPAKATVALDSSKPPVLGTYPPNTPPHFWTDGIERIVANEEPAKANTKGRTITTSAVRRRR